MLELQPGMVSKICESFKVPSHGCGTFSRCPDRKPAAHDNGRVGYQTEKVRLSTWWYFVQDPTGIRAEPINDTLPRDRQREPIAQGLIANTTNGITKDRATREIVG